MIWTGVFSYFVHDGLRVWYYCLYGIEHGVGMTKAVCRWYQNEHGAMRGNLVCDYDRSAVMKIFELAGEAYYTDYILVSSNGTVK